MITEQKTYDNLQDIFNDMYNGMIAQKEPSIEFGIGGCKYRMSNSNGSMLACVVGQVLSDASIKKLGLLKSNPPILTDENMRDPNNFLMSELESSKEIVNTLLPNLPADIATNFLADMQMAHDGAAPRKSDSIFIDRFKAAASEVAAKYNLTVPADPTP